MKNYGFIFARGGSKGVPMKNIKLLCGKPLIAYAIEAGLQSGVLDKVIVSTDSEQIAAVAREYGAQTPFLRPAELASDTAPELLAWRHAAAFLADRGETFDTFVSLPAPSPLRTPEVVRQCVDMFQRGGCDVLVTCTKAQHFPPFTILTKDDQDYARIAMPLDPMPTRRQDVPPFYDMTGVVFITTPSYIENNTTIWNGRVKALEVDRITAIDIDEIMDFEIAELYMEKRLRLSKSNT